MDFNIVTFHTAYNFGAVLQTYALQEFITDLGYEAGVFDYRPTSKKSRKNLKSKFISGMKIVNREQEVVRKRRYTEFLNQYIKTNLEMNSKVFLTGSDQVWNTYGPMDSTYYLSFVGNDSIKASYAASMGKTSVPDGKRLQFERYIQRLDAVSVREEDTNEFISKFYNDTVSTNVDPTLLKNSEFWCKIERKPDCDLPDRFILAYILHRPKNVNELLRWLKKETGLPVVLIDSQGILSCFVKNDISLLDLGPREFIWLFHYAEAVVTSSFHGTAFSIIFQKEFYSVVNPASPSRILNILKKLDLSYVSEDQVLFERNQNVDWSLVENKLFEEKQRSENYLRRVFSLSEDKHRNTIKNNVEAMKERCTGCSACMSNCPTKSISMTLNCQGFFEPVINTEKCINCGICLEKCPLENKVVFPKIKSYYGKHNDDSIIYNSSSGGAFAALANAVLQEGGIVFAAKYTEDYRSVIFSDTDHCILQELQKSKYTVSNPGEVYSAVKTALNSGRKVLFCGTPCQCAGLTSFLGKEYDRLVKCDFVCGGMASLTFYREHLDVLEKKYGKRIASIDFRPKDKGWGKHYLKITFIDQTVLLTRDYNDSYFNCFVEQHVSVRAACLNCEFRAFHASDITLADFWGYRALKIQNDKKGLSLLVANTNKGVNNIEKLQDMCIQQIDNEYSSYAFSGSFSGERRLNKQKLFFEQSIQSGFECTAEKLYPTGVIAQVKKKIRSKLI